MTTLVQRLPSLSEYGIESHWLRQQSTTRNLLFVYAHPDDESFGNAGAIARYSAAGIGVHYVCATHGEVGTVSPEFPDGYASVGDLRRDELLCAAHTLRLASVHFLGYRDSGMLGAPDNQDRNAFMNAPLEQAVSQLVAVIRAVQPQVIVTFNPFGGYGHPDHIMAHEVTGRAFQAASDPQLEPGLPAWRPQKLYYSTFGTRWLKLAIIGLRLLGKDPRRLGTNADTDIVQAAVQAGSITTSVNTAGHLDQKAQAWQCHRSQIGEMGRLLKLPRFIQQKFMGAEHFTRVVPSWDDNNRPEVDLFADVPQ